MDAYFKNMELSQARTRSVLEYTITLPAVTNQQEWLIEKLPPMDFLIVKE